VEDMPQLCDCRGCGAPFVVPVDLLDIVDEGLYLVALWCSSCDHLALAEVEDGELESLEVHLRRTTEQMHAEADALGHGLEPSV